MADDKNTVHTPKTFSLEKKTSQIDLPRKRKVNIRILFLKLIIIFGIIKFMCSLCTYQKSLYFYENAEISINRTRDEIAKIK